MRERKKIIRSVFLCAFVSAFVACSNKADYKDSSLPVETRVQDLLGRMTVEEKAAQLDMLSAKEIVIDENTLSDEQLKHFVDSMCIGAVHDLYPAHAAVANLIQKHAVENSRLGIPLLFIEEGFLSVILRAGIQPCSILSEGLLPQKPVLMACISYWARIWILLMK